MFNPTFTQDPRRIQRLRENYEEGVRREALPLAQREKMDVDALTPSADHIKELFQTAFTQMMFRKAQRQQQHPAAPMTLE